MIDTKTKKDFEEAQKKIKYPYSIHLEDWKGKTSGITVLHKVDESLKEKRGEEYYSIEGTFIHPNWAVIEVERRIKLKNLLNKIDQTSLSEKEISEMNEILKRL